MSEITGYRVSPQQAEQWETHQNFTTLNWLKINVPEPCTVEFIQNNLDKLVLNEEILRTHLKYLPGMNLPIQIIEETDNTQLKVVNLKNTNNDEKDFILTLEKQNSEQNHDQENKLAVYFIPFKDKPNQLLLCANPYLLDFNSLIYTATALIGEPLNQERLQYIDYAQWKHDLLEDSNSIAGTQYWGNVTPDTSSTLLPGLSSRPTQKTQKKCEAASITLDTANIQTCCAALNLPLDELIFCAWGILLSRLKGQNQLQLMWIDTSRDEETETALGLYEQLLPIDIEIDLKLPLHIQKDILTQKLRLAQGWKDYYDSSKHHPERENQAYITCRVIDKNQANFLKSDFSFCANHNFPLGLDCVAVENDRGQLNVLRLSLNYQASQFSHDAINNIAEQWQLLIEGLCSVNTPINSIALFGEYQAKQLSTSTLQATTDTTTIDSDIDIITLIEKHAKKTPQAAALADATGIISYSELTLKVNKLARYLQHIEIQVGDTVGILLPRNQHTIIVILAVMKAGAAYLPLDVSYPSDRLAYMIDDSNASLVISTSEYINILSETLNDDLTDTLDKKTSCVLLDKMGTVVENFSGDHFESPTTLSDLAYLIYTSGSTGKPKAVEINRQCLSHSTQVRIDFYQQPVNAYLLLSSFAFDSSVAGIFWTLTTGGLLVLPATGEELDLRKLTELIKQHNISHSLSLPSLYEALLNFSNNKDLASISHWIVAGEACSEQVLKKHNEKLPSARLINEYGPTEATVWATADILTENKISEENISIGKPIPTMELYIINEQGCLAAIGEPGEIYLGGPTLSSGYRGKPEQTANAFISSDSLCDTNTFFSITSKVSDDFYHAKKRLYKTGDLARYRYDGRLDFLGRRDHQIKIRGYRIELGEIERVLLKHSEIRETVVIAQPHNGNHRLVAYFTDQHGYTADALALNSFLSDHLPPYMVPDIFVPLKSLPLTPNGKIDQKALPDPQSVVRQTVEFIAPRTDMEKRLAAIFIDVLNLEKIGVLDDFFSIGGDSILSLQIVARANQLGIGISAKQVFESANIENLATVASIIDPDDIDETESTPQGRISDEEASVDNFPLADLDGESFDALLEELDV